MIRRTFLSAAIGLALGSGAIAQPAGEPPQPRGDASIPLTYVGTNARVALGIDDDGNILGELLGFLGVTDERAWAAQLWKGHRNAGGVQLGYHWLVGDEAPRVMKVFAAADQNAERHRKLSVGLGIERNDFSVDAYLMHGLTDGRLIDTQREVIERQIQGSDGQGDYVQMETIETLTRRFDRAYDDGVGLRFGKFIDPALLRVRGGLDHERGKYSSSQSTLSLGLEKYISDTGFSVALQAEHLRKRGDFVADRSDTRGWLMVRYEFGQTYRPREPFRMVQVEVPVAAAAEQPQPQVVRNQVKLDGDAFFAFDHHDLSADAVRALDALLAQLHSDARVSRVAIVGHTDAIGSVEYNQGLSERRAHSARDYLVAHGVDAGQIDVRGEGKLNPAYPNDTPENRQKNRRVDIEFLTIEESVVPITQPAAQTEVQWVREPIDASPAWIERALRNPAQHKRVVDVYRYEESSTTSTVGEREYLNRPPTAADDELTLHGCVTSFSIDVLANDSDPDGDALTVSGVSGVSHGEVQINADGTLSYQVTNEAAFCNLQGAGGDVFTYQISDGRGGTDSATVTVHVVPDPANSPPVANDDTARVMKGGAIDIPVLDNDFDPDGDPLTVISVEHTGFGNTALSINPDNTVRYESLRGTMGYDSFTYTISDGRGGTDTATVTVYVWMLAPHVVSP